MEQEVVKTETNAAVEFDPNCMGAGDDITSSDLRIGIIALAQSSSKPVKADEVRQGCWYDWEAKKELGYKDKEPVEVVIVSTHRFWIERENDSFKTRYPGTHSGELKWEEGDTTREFNHAFLVLLPSQVKDGIEVPYEVSFKSSSLKVSQKISKILMGMRRHKQASWNRKFKLTCKLVEAGGFSWFAPEVEVGEETTPEERKSAYTWFKTLQDVDVNKNVGSGGFEEKETEGNMY